MNRNPVFESPESEVEAMTKFIKQVLTLAETIFGQTTCAHQDGIIINSLMNCAAIKEAQTMVSCGANTVEEGLHVLGISLESFNEERDRHYLGMLNQYVEIFAQQTNAKLTEAERNERELHRQEMSLQMQDAEKNTPPKFLN